MQGDAGGNMVAQHPTMVLGWREWVGLPTLGVPFIKAKLDTGARTSAIHAYDIEPFERDGVTWLRFVLHPDQRSTRLSVPCEAPMLDRRAVRSSDGALSDRYAILTPLSVAGFNWNIELTLAGRDDMGFRMLLGREALRGRVLVDPGAAYAAGKRRRKKPKA
jgi:hypothetical protein